MALALCSHNSAYKYKEPKSSLELVKQLSVGALIILLMIATVKGLILVKSINAVRYAVIVILVTYLLMNKVMIFGHSCKMNHWIAASYLLIVITILLPTIGFCFNKPIAWWQESLWVGTAYNSMYLLFACIFVLFRRPLLEGGLVCTSAACAALVCDSRAMQIDAIVVAILFLCEIIRRQSHPTRRIAIGLPKSRYIFFVGAYMWSLVLSLNIYLSHPNNQVISFNPLLTASKSTGIFSNVQDVDWGTDIDRKQQIDLVYNRLRKYPLKAMLGNGILTHQLFYTKTNHASHEQKYRPVGLTSFALDFGLLTLSVLIIVSVVKLIDIAKKQRGVDAIWSSTVQIVLVSSFFLHMILTDTFDSILFWLVLTANSIFAVARSNQT